MGGPEAAVFAILVIAMGAAALVAVVWLRKGKPEERFHREDVQSDDEVP